MKIQSRSYVKGDYELFIRSLTKDNMEQLFIENFGGWSDEVSSNKFFDVVKKGFVELFFSDDVFLGYVSFNLEKNDNTSCLINDIHLLKEFQKKGIGSVILNFVLSKSKELGFGQVKVFVFEKNPSIEFYKKKGFVQIEFLSKSNTSVMIKKID